MTDFINYIVLNPRTWAGVGVWIMLAYQLYRSIRFYKIGLNFPLTEISKSSGGIGRFKLNLETTKPVAHPITKEPLAGYEIEFWIRDTKYRRKVGVYREFAEGLEDSGYELKIDKKTMVNTRNEEVFLKPKNVKENLELYEIAKKCLGNKKDLWRNKITDLSLPIVVYIKSVSLTKSSILSYLDKDLKIIRSLEPSEKFKTMIFDQDYNTKGRDFFQKYRIFALTMSVFGFPAVLFIGNTNPALGGILFAISFFSAISVYMVAGILDTGTFDEV